MNTQTTNGTDSRLTQCFAAVFPALDAAQLKHATQDSLEAWDSLATVTLIHLIEDEFQVEIPFEKIEELMSFESFLQYLKSV